VGIGTCFRIYLPAADGQPAAEAHGGRDLGALRGSETVLLIEDDPSLRLMVRRFLERMQYTLLIAPNGESAIERCRGYEGDIHLVLCDVVLPDMDGPRVVAELRALRPGLKPLFMSAYSGETVVRRGLLLPEMPFISKPFTIDEIGRKLREVLRA
jgi:CheY-like chemotaxis protein